MLFQFVKLKKFDLLVEIHAKFALFTFMSLFVKCCTLLILKNYFPHKIRSHVKILLTQKTMLKTNQD